MTESPQHSSTEDASSLSETTEDQSQWDICRHFLEAFEEMKVQQDLAKEAAREEVVSSFASVLADMTGTGYLDNMWHRPNVSDDVLRSNLRFQHLDLRDAIDEDGKPTLLIFGLTKHGNTICLHLTDLPDDLFLPPMELFADDDGPETSFCETAGDTSAILDEASEEPRTLPKLNDNEALGAFMKDNNISVLSWLEVAKDKFCLTEKNECLSSCQLECSARFKDVMFSRSNSIPAEHAPMRILSFDIETSVNIETGNFPSAKRNEVIQIASLISNIASPDIPLVRDIMTLSSCDPISGARVSSYQSEAELLDAWASFVCEADPDIIAGYNINRFDFPFLLKRSLRCNLKKMSNLGRLRKRGPEVENFPVMDVETFKSNTHFFHHGRLVFDLYAFMCSNYTKESLGNVPGARGLDNVSKHFLNDKKEGITVQDMHYLQSGTSGDRRKLAIYCLKDTFLPLKLMKMTDCFHKTLKQLLPFSSQDYSGVTFNSIVRQAFSPRQLELLDAEKDEL